MSFFDKLDETGGPHALPTTSANEAQGEEIGPTHGNNRMQPVAINRSATANEDVMKDGPDDIDRGPVGERDGENISGGPTDRGSGSLHTVEP